MAAPRLPGLFEGWVTRTRRELAPRLKEFKRGMHSFRKSAIALAGLVIIGAFLIMAFIAPALAPPVSGTRDPFEMPVIESEAWCPPAAADAESWTWLVATPPTGAKGTDFQLFLPPVNVDTVGQRAWFEVDAFNRTGAMLGSEKIHWTLDGEPAATGAAYQMPLTSPGDFLVRATVEGDFYDAVYNWRVAVPNAKAQHLIVLSPRTVVTVSPTRETVSLQILQIRVCNEALINQGTALKTVDWTLDDAARGNRADLPVPMDAAAHAVTASYTRPTYVLGQTESGKDVYYGVIWGSRISMRIGLEVVLVSIVAGALLGLLAGYHGRWIDEALMRVTDVFFGLPSLILAMTVIVSLGPTLDNLVIALVIVSWPGYSRLIRGVALTVKTNLYVEAARASGTRTGAILRRHIFPNTVSPLMVQATLDIGSVVLTAAGLSFIGFSFVTPNTAEWGRLVFVGQQQLGASSGQIWWPVLYPGLFIFLFVLGFNMLGDGLRDVLDPRLRR